MKGSKVTLAAAALWSFLANHAMADTLSVVSWNKENWGESDSGIIAKQLRDDFDAIDVFGLCEVQAESEFALYADYAGRDEAGPYGAVPGTTGANTKLGILYRTDKFELVETYEMLDMMGSVAPGKQPTGRAPLVAHLKAKSDGAEFLFVVNHFHRGDERKRLEQAMLFANWAGEQTVPVIAVGDYNFDFDIDTKLGNPAFDAFNAIASFKWIEPTNVITTNWSDQNGDGKNDYNSILDFVFLANSDWKAKSSIVIRPNDLPDDKYTSDHRPVLAVFETDSARELTWSETAFIPAPSSEISPLDQQFISAVPARRDQNLSIAASRTVQQTLSSGPFANLKPFAGEGSENADLKTLLERINSLTKQVEELNMRVK